MTAWIVGIAIVLGCFGLVLFYGQKGIKAEEDRQNSLAKAAAERRTRFDQARAAYLAERFCLSPFLCQREGNPAAIAIEPDGLRIVSWIKPSENFYESRFEEESNRVFTVVKDDLLQFSSMISVSFRQDELTESFKRKVSTPVAVSKKKSAIGRGLAGAVVAGPVGAVVGAVSAAVPSQRVEMIDTFQDEIRAVKGLPTLSITSLADVPQSENLAFTKAEDAQSWVHMISHKAGMTAKPPSEF